MKVFGVLCLGKEEVFYQGGALISGVSLEREVPCTTIPHKDVHNGEDYRCVATVHIATQ